MGWTKEIDYRTFGEVDFQEIHRIRFSCKRLFIWKFNV